MKAVVFLNGEYKYSQEFIDRLFDEETVLLCADGGANYAYKYSKRPSYIIGDLDSIDNPVLEYFKTQGINIVKYNPEKDYTDFELILQKIDELEKKNGFKYKSINRDIQLFDEEFQRLMPLYFWESKRSDISEYFRNRKTVKQAAYAVAQEWASAGVPKGEFTKSKNESDGGLVTYYDDKPGNKAHYSADVTIKALNDTKKMINAAGGYDAVREISLSKIRG